MKSLFFTATVLLGSFAQADGFKCISESGLNIKVYNETDANLGTRNAAVMVLSDANVGFGNKTIATFKAAKNVLVTDALTYTAKVDLRVSESNRKGELIGGTKLGYLSSVQLTVGFSYSNPVAEGTKMPATLVLQKRDGQKLLEDVVCTRYLKN